MTNPKQEGCNEMSSELVSTLYPIQLGVEYCFGFVFTGSTFLNLVLKMNPVVLQPRYGAGGATVSDWQTGVFDCCDDVGICKCTWSLLSPGLQLCSC